MSDNPKNDNAIEGLDSDFSVSGNIITMHCNGPTSFSVGKNGRGFSDSIGGCNMDFKATAARGYAYKADDVRDLEFKCWMRVPNNLSSGHDGFSMSACTGRHTGSSCCQGFAYMGSLDNINSNPTRYRFRKETVHVQYTDAPETIPSKTHPKMNFAVAGHGWIGWGFCRYNKPTNGGTSPRDDSVILEIWFNPDPTNNVADWTMLQRIEDKKGKGWTGSKGKCNGDNDQIGVWSGAHNRLKSNSTSGTIQFTSISFREINPFGTFEEPPPPITCPPGQHPLPDGSCVPDTPGGGDGGGGSEVPPTEPTKVKGFFTLKRDINIYRTDACEGTGGSGGGGGGAGHGVIYDAFPDNDIQLSDTSAWSFRTRIASQLNKTASGYYNKILKQLSVPLKKVGSPAATPTITAVIWDKNNNVVYTSPTAIDPTTLPTSFNPSDPTAWEQFDFSTNTHVFVLGDRVGVRYFADSSTSDVNYVVGGYEVVTQELNATMIRYESSVWKEDKLRDWAAVFYD